MKGFLETRENALENRKWFVVDATDKHVGRLASQVAAVLRGKHNPRYTPHVDTGDFVVVINADKVKFSGLKEERKVYYRHTGFTGGIKATTPAKLRAKKPEEIVKKAVTGMIPKTNLGRKQAKKLRVYVGDVHPHSAQQLKELTV